MPHSKEAVHADGHSSTSLTHSYCLYSAILALKLLALAPMASIMCNAEKVKRANISDLKNLTPFWLVAALYTTTSPDQTTALTLLRLYVAARFVAAVGYLKRLPKMVVEGAFFVSFAITAFMGGTTMRYPSESTTVSLDSPLMQAYMAHAGLLAFKLLALSSLAAMTWVRKGIFPNPDIVRRAYLSELKNVAPFWVSGALYVTTHPTEKIGITLFRIYTVARFMVVFGYATKPVPAAITDLALVTSYMINSFMSLSVVFFYRNAL